MLSRPLVVLLLLGLFRQVALADEPRPLQFYLTLDRKVSATPVQGRVVVLLSTRGGEPRFGPNWFTPEPMFARDVNGWKPGETLILGRESLGFPTSLDKLPKRMYTIQAILDLDQGGRSFSLSPGNGYSKTIRQELDPATSGPVNLAITEVVAETPPKETERVKFFEVESPLLSAFHKRPTKLRAGVVLPKSFEKMPERHYPIVYEIPGFGGTHTMALGVAARGPTDVAGTEMLWVVLDPSCRLGHHVFADSANNGPVGQALVEELIPKLEKQFRAVGTAKTRFVTGHSSGGWTSLWLQVAYPETFGGCWSTAPDPIDFRDFQRINIYRAGENMFVDREGNPRPIARRNGNAVLFYKPFSDMDRVTGRGGQLDSFDACFSPRGPNGRPMPLWNRDTGAIDLEVARHWEKYDIRLLLERNWKTLGPKLAGKIHVFTGAEDTFYLEGAVALLKEAMTRLGSDAVVEVIPDRDHGNLITRALRERISKGMAERAASAR